MRRVKLLFLLMVMVAASSAVAQEKLDHEKSKYVGPDGKLFVNLELPVYLYMSTEKGGGGNHQLLESKKTKDYANPMYFDEEGYNTIRSPWCADTAGRMAKPKKDVVFEVYADGTPPETRSKFDVAPEYLGNQKVYYGKNLQVELKASDELADVKKVYYSVNGSSYEAYKQRLKFSNDPNNKYNLKYYAVDHVGNVEKAGQRTFWVDETPPEPTADIKGLVVGDNKTNENGQLVLDATDNLSGVDQVQYYIDDNPYHPYNKPLTVDHLSNGMHTLHYVCSDNVENKRSKQTMTFEIDKLPPELDIEIQGDQFKGDHHYISPSTQIAIQADDKQSKIKATRYSINHTKLDQTYQSPFTIGSRQGLKKVRYHSEDVLKNVSENQLKTVFLDKQAPTTEISYERPKHTIDQLFINKDTRIKLHSSDQESGVSNIEYKVDDGSWASYSSRGISVKEAGSHQISFRSYDKVNNKEKTKSSSFFVDNKAPKIFAKFSIDATGSKKKDGKSYDVYPPRTRLFFGATDANCGTDQIFYSINEGSLEQYATGQNIDIAERDGLQKGGFYRVKVIAKDKLGNAREKTLKFFIRQ